LEQARWSAGPQRSVVLVDRRCGRLHRRVSARSLAILPSYTVAFTFTAAIGLGAFFSSCAVSQWIGVSVVIRRIMETSCDAAVGGALCSRRCLRFEGRLLVDESRLMVHDEVLKGKAGFLSQDFFLLRTLIYFACGRSGSTPSTISHQAGHRAQFKQMHIMSRWSARAVSRCSDRLDCLLRLAHVDPAQVVLDDFRSVLPGRGALPSGAWSRWCAWASARPAF